MAKYSLVKDHNSKYEVVHSQRVTFNENNSGCMLDGHPITLITSCDDKAALKEICVNLNSQSPKINLIKSYRRSKPKIISNVIVKTPRVLKIPCKKGGDTENESNESGSVYEPESSQSEIDENHAMLKSEKIQSKTKEDDANDSNRSNISLVEYSKSSDSSTNLDFSFNVPGNSACDDTELKSKLSTDVKNTKKHLCIYCDKLQTQLGRHLILKHPNEDKVKEFIHLPPKSHERLGLIAEIRKKGEFKVFTNAALNKGEFIPARRPANAEKAKAEYFATCPNCKGVYTKNNLRHHYAQCANNVESVQGVLKNARITVGRIHERASQKLRQKVMPSMKEDEVLRCIRYDLLIILYGNDLCLRHRHAYMHKLIRANLRLCGRFLLHIKKLDPTIVDFSSIYDPSKYYFLLNAIDLFAGVDESTGHYSKTGNATEMSKHINKIGDIYLKECIINKEPDKQKQVADFLSLCKGGFAAVTNKTAMETLVARQRDKTIELPSTADIMCLCQHLDKLIDVNYASLKSKFSYSAWRQLAEAVLTRVQVFNRRRAGEAERLLISALKKVQTITKKDEDFKSLSKEEKKAAHEYVRLEVRGKLNSNVPILLTRKWYNALKLIVNHRNNAGVSKKNLHVFGIEGHDEQSFLSATALMRRFSDECNAANPKSLRGTPLRKHVATKCSQYGLDKTETARVAKFMGHDIRVHENIYKQPVAKSDILGISKVLEKAQQVHDDSVEIDTSMNSNPGLNDLNTSHDVSNLNSTNTNSSMNNDSLNNSVMGSEMLGSDNLNAQNSKRYKIRRVPWTKTEIKLVETHFANYIKSKKLPSLPAIRSVQRHHNILSDRRAEVIKAWINNTITKKTKKNSVKNTDRVTTTENVKVNNRIKIIFSKYIANNTLPTLSKCLIAKQKDKLLETLPTLKIQRLVQSFLE